MADKHGELVQLLGLIVLGVGCGIELAYRAALGLILISVGSIVFAVGTKLKGR